MPLADSQAARHGLPGDKNKLGEWNVAETTLPWRRDPAAP